MDVDHGLSINRLFSEVSALSLDKCSYDPYLERNKMKRVRCKDKVMDLFNTIQALIAQRLESKTDA